MKQLKLVWIEENWRNYRQGGSHIKKRRDGGEDKRFFLRIIVLYEEKDTFKMLEVLGGEHDE